MSRETKQTCSPADFKNEEKRGRNRLQPPICCIPSLLIPCKEPGEHSQPAGSYSILPEAWWNPHSGHRVSIVTSPSFSCWTHLLLGPASPLGV